LEEWVAEQDSVEEVERLLDKEEVPCLRVRTLQELADTDPQIKAREMMPLVEQPFIGPMKMYGSPLKMSETPSCIRGHAPILGEHNEDVLAGVLGYSKEQVNAMYGEDILYHEPAVDRLKG
jgi:crotonobetainyl-CoA:carnitine CoA-transferase CaiB-like acyl-CoA transferase